MYAYIPSFYHRIQSLQMGQRLPGLYLAFSRPRYLSPPPAMQVQDTSSAPDNFNGPTSYQEWVLEKRGIH